MASMPAPEPRLSVESIEGVPLVHKIASQLLVVVSICLPATYTLLPETAIAAAWQYIPGSSQYPAAYTVGPEELPPGFFQEQNITSAHSRV
jgi:hypothetical protein